MTDAARRSTWLKFGCRACVHFHPRDCTCDAFPAGVPIEIASAQLDHFEPRKGDRGIQFELKPGVDD